MVSVKKLSMVIIGTALSFVYLGLKPAHAHMEDDRDHSQSPSESSAEKPGNFLLVTPDTARPTYSSGGDELKFLALGSDTAGQYSAYQFTVPPGDELPLQVHQQDSEAVYVLGGKLTLNLDGQTVDATPGTFAYLPAGRPRQVTNNGTTPATVLGLDFPAQSFAPYKGNQDFLVVPPAAPGRPVYDSLGGRYTFLADGEDTDGQFGLVDVVNPPGVGVPAHIHSREDEAYYILDGNLDVLMDDKTMTATPESFLYLPRDHAHAFMTSGTTPVHMLGLITPPQFLNFFEDTGVAVTDLSAPIAPPLDLATIESIATNEYGLKFVLPSTSPTAVPEPSSLLGLFGFGAYLGVSLVLKRKHKKQKLTNRVRGKV